MAERQSSDLSASGPPRVQALPPSRARTRFRVLKASLLVLVLTVAMPLAVLHAGFAASLPRLDGRIDVAGLTAPVSISRDALGIPTIEADTRADLAFGIGFAHAQDRFFQMDLSRRLAAGELSELFGRAALEQDRAARVFRFRNLAQQVVSNSPPDQRALIEAYARGVNAGLASLRSRPWEYWLLQAEPVPWKPEDTALASYAMWWDLQYSGVRRDMLKRALNARLGGAECEHGWKCALAFFYPHGTSWDAPNGARSPSTPSPVRIPTPEELNVRGHAPSAPAVSQGHSQGERPTATGLFAGLLSTVAGNAVPRALEGVSGALASASREPPIGSNGWVVSGKLTSNGSALVASDMHLNLRVPIVWYRARMKLRQHAVGEGAAALDLNGLTLPGAPVLVAGSNGHVAWAFTNSYGDWADVTLVPCVAADENSIRTATETIPLTVVRETLRVKGEPDVVLPVRSGPAGLLFSAQPEQGRCGFVHWIATVPAATNFNILRLETATSTEQVLNLAPSIGIPHQNMMVGDRAGHVAWTIAGRVPDAVSEDRLSGSAPWTTPATHPALLDPEAGRLWTANARPIDDAAAEARIGGDEASLGADYDLGARASQIRDRLMALGSGVRPEDMLRIQLDDRAVFLTRWRDLLLGLLDEAALAQHPQRAEFRQIIAQWRARASTDSVGYRLVRTFRDRTEFAVWSMLLDALQLHAPEAPPSPQFEGALWALVTQQPMHMLAARFPSWRDFLLAQVDATLSELAQACPQLARCTWGERNPVRVRHPLSGALPFASRLLDMPTLQLPGDHDMPRVQDGSFGASNRFAVSPGHETESYLHIAGAQSGHPLSPYYRAGFREWAEGKPLPFLPGRAEHTLTLAPDR
ncbi:MAG: penicillin acylase family protein [Steroidobacteraceae bacterium]|nr:penicillin acylase family protein [Steroidobacteraceae bacterium]